MKALVLCALLALAMPVLAKKGEHTGDGLKNAVILVIRHAEKPATGANLSPAGVERAQAYVDYFRRFTVDSQPLKLDYLYAAADSKESTRASQTLQPLGKALGLAVDARFAQDKTRKLADDIRRKPSGKQFLVCWHHGEIPQLVGALGADAGKLFPKKKWPDDVFGWVVQLRYDAAGQLVDARRIEENLMPDDSGRRGSGKR